MKAMTLDQYKEVVEFGKAKRSSRIYLNPLTIRLGGLEIIGNRYENSELLKTNNK